MKFAEEHSMAYYETSAKKGVGIETLFEDMAKQLYDKYKRKGFQSSGGNGRKLLVDKTEKNTGKISRCC